MFIDARTLPSGSVIEAALCIVGAGAAGITLARELAGGSLDVCLLESGGLQIDAVTQSLYGGENAGLPYFPLDLNRQRSFGGTTNLWAGWCRPLEELDFEARAWVPNSGWPVSKSELAPYYRRAHEVCELGPFEYDPRYWSSELNEAVLPLGADHAETRIYQLSPPTRFGERYRDQLARATNLRVLLYANAMRIDTGEGGSAVSRLQAGCLAGNRFSIVAKRYVLACGGLENARLLLLSNVARGNDPVGRYFMEHIHFPSGAIWLIEPAHVPPSWYCGAHQRVIARLSLPRAVQEREGLLNYSARLEPVYHGDESGLVAAWRRAAHAVKRWRLRGDPLRTRTAQMAMRDESVRGGVPLGSWRGLKALRIRHTLEQSPHAESRVTLSTDRDALDLPRIRLEWRTTSLEEWTAQRARDLIDRQLAQQLIRNAEGAYVIRRQVRAAIGAAQCALQHAVAVQAAHAVIRGGSKTPATERRTDRIQHVHATRSSRVGRGCHSLIEVPQRSPLASPSAAHMVMTAEPRLQPAYNPETYWNARARANAADPLRAVGLDDTHQNRCIDRIQRQLLSAAVRRLGGRRVVAHQTVLDYGCGTGRWIPFWCGLGCLYSGVDIAEEMITLARQRHPDMDLRKVGDGRVPYPDRRFDLVCSIAVVHHNPYAAQSTIVAELARVLKSGGTLILFEGLGSASADVYYPRRRAEWIGLAAQHGLSYEWNRGTTYLILLALLRRMGISRGQTWAARLDARVDPFLVRVVPARYHTRAVMIFRRR